MALRIAINGYGRIGRNIMRAAFESNDINEIDIVAINDLGDPSLNAHLTKYDSIHHHLPFPVEYKEGRLAISNKEILVFSEPEPNKLPWKDLDIDLVFECTGRYTTKERAQLHLQSGAKRVLVSAPTSNADATIVYGVNHDDLLDEHKIISNASCTTNCLAPIAKILNNLHGIQSGLMTTIHAYTNDQHLADVNAGDPYRSRAAALSMIPTKTGAATAVGLVLPELNGKLSGLAVRVPTANVSLVDLTYQTDSPLSEAEINQAVRNASAGKFQGIVTFNDEPLVSIDFNHNPSSCIFDCTQTHVCGSQVKVFAWYDNEWGFSNRMLDMAKYIAKHLN